MSVPSFDFLGLVLVGALVFNLSSSLVWRNLVFLVLNLGFFCTFLHGPVSALPYLGFLATGYVGVWVLTRRSDRFIFPVLVVLVLCQFFVLKRYTFVPGQALIPFVYTSIGLSYVFFRVLHLVIDAGQGGLREGVGVLSYINYTLNFTSLVSGPIQMYPDYRRMAERERLPLDLFVIARAGERMIVGLFKVAVISVLLHNAQLALIERLDAPNPMIVKSALSAAIIALYPLFLYANFSGYTDFVIGAARLFRLVLPENFDRPFTSENFISFWGRWHITLSNWLKTYVYTPLLIGAMRRIESPAFTPYFGVGAYFVTFFLVGAWHGQTATFLFFGVLQGGGVAVNKLFQLGMSRWLTPKGYRALSARPLYKACARGLTFTWFAFTLLWFWSSWPQLGQLARASGPGAIAAALLLIFVVATVGLSGLAAVERLSVSPSACSDELPRSRYWRVVLATAMLATLAAVTLISSGPAPDVVYKNF